MRVTPEIRELILGHGSVEALRVAATEDGMVPMPADGLMKAAAGQTSLAELVRVAT
jgi:type II secretory ATPase GspE/PulE/Tfp pilus assembly ATPase PilB-like protein